MTFIETSTSSTPDAQERAVLGRRMVVLVNQGAGTLEGQDGQSFRAKLESGFHERGISAEVVLLDAGGVGTTAREAVANAVRERLDAIVVGGGDGTIRTVASLVVGTGLPLGILPLGTLNHFAKDAGIPGQLDAALDVVAAGSVHAVDVGEVNGRLFINNSSIGLYPSLVLRREQARRANGHSKWVATALAVPRILRQLPLHRLSIYANGAKEPVRTPCLFVGNNRYGLRPTNFGQRDSLEAGELCLYVAKQRSRLALLWLAIRSFCGFIDRKRDLRTISAPTAEIRSRKSRLFVAMDGEVELMHQPLIYRSRPRALQVLGPP